MFFQVSHVGCAGRAFNLFKKSQTISSKVERYVTNAVIQGLRYDSILYTKTTTIPNSSRATPDANEMNQDGVKSLDRSLKMSLLKKNFAEKGLGLKLAKNREYLVMDFYNLSKSVMENQLSVDDFVATETFKKLQEQVEYNIDVMNNAQIVNLLASIIKMKINPSTSIVKLLEHEVKFRLKLFNLNQIIKMFRFYNSTEMSSEQKQIAEMLSYRMRSYIQNEAMNVSELNSVLLLIATQQIPASLLGLVEERLLNLLTKSVEDEDDIVSKYIQSNKPYDYNSLCNLFIRLAENKQRPTPLLKAATMQLFKETSSDYDATLIISTLNALNILSYPNRALISKLIDDLVKVINLKELDSNTLCNLLRSIGILRWKSEELLSLLFDHVENYKKDLKVVDHNVVVGLLHVTALLNYQHKNLQRFYDNCMKGPREDMLDKQSRKWLNYVWSLVSLKINTEAHIRSVLNSNYYRQESDMSSSRLAYSDILKLINLRALCCYEMKLDGMESVGLDLIKPPTQRSQIMQKFASKVQKVINTMVDNPQNFFIYDIETPFGFNIDCEVHLNDQLEFVPIGNISFREIIDFNTDAKTYNLDRRRCAIILASYEDIVASSQGDEVVGHKLMISRILKSIGYSTAFLSDTMINREKTSVDVADRIRTIIKNSMISSNNVDK